LFSSRCFSTVLLIGLAGAFCGCGRAAASVERAALSRAAVAGESREATLRSVFLKDTLRDRGTAVSVLRRPRTVFRYAAEEEVIVAQRNGIAAGRHFTSRAGAGRPLSIRSASNTFGLLRQPSYRMTVTLPRGTSVKFNRVLGGRPGLGEIVNVRPLPKSNLDRVLPLGKK
jgi:hypothetical protein